VTSPARPATLASPRAEKPSRLQTMTLRRLAVRTTSGAPCALACGRKQKQRGWRDVGMGTTGRATHQLLDSVDEGTRDALPLVSRDDAEEVEVPGIELVYRADRPLCERRQPRTKVLCVPLAQVVGQELRKLVERTPLRVPAAQSHA